MQLRGGFYNLVTELAMILATIYYLVIELTTILAMIFILGTISINEFFYDDHSLKKIF